MATKYHQAVQGLRMVPVTRVADAFHARVLAARLGSEGVVTQLRGGGVDGPYPVGDVEVLVSVEDLDLARGLLLADEVESAFDDVDDEGPAVGRSLLAPWIVLAVLIGLVLFAYVNTIGYQHPPDQGPRRSGQQGGQGLLVEPLEGAAPVGAGQDRHLQVAGGQHPVGTGQGVHRGP